MRIRGILGCPIVILVLFVLSGAQPARAASFYVGSSLGCTHGTLPAAVAAAQANGVGTDTIYLTQNQVLTAPLSVTGTDVQILGGTVSCGHTARSGRSRVDLKPGVTISVGPVAALFDGIDFDHGTAPLGSNDRILSASGAFNLTVRNASFTNGHADTGGNLRLTGTSGSRAALENVVVMNGTAANIGGGILCEGPVQMSWTGPIDILGNISGYNGGGVALVEGCQLEAATFSRTGSGGAVRIRYNDAGLAGGGLYLTVTTSSGPDSVTAATLRGGSAYAVQIFDNTARLGGGTYLSNYYDVGIVQLTAYNTLFTSNTATTAGGAVYLRGNSLATIDRNTSACHSADFCSAMSWNQALGTLPFPAGYAPYYPPGQGGAAFLEGPARLVLRQTRIDHSQSGNGASVLIAQGTGGRVEAEGVVLHANEDSGSGALLTLAGSGASMRLAHVSSAANLTTNTGRLVSGGVVEIYSSIFGESRPQVIGSLSAGSKIDCSIFPSLFFLPIAATRSGMVSNPADLFVDPVNGDLHLTATSRGIDYCDTSSYAPVDRDVDHQGRGADHPFVDTYGPYDIGADEVIP